LKKVIKNNKISLDERKNMKQSFNEDLIEEKKFYSKFKAYTNDEINEYKSIKNVLANRKQFRDTKRSDLKFYANTVKERSFSKSSKSIFVSFKLLQINFIFSILEF
jgi:hypothetical protein